MATILESQGHYMEAIDIYNDLLQKNPQDRVILQKLSRYSDVNIKLLEYFVKMSNKDDYKKFERWLTKWS
jgi:hypothetical protein